MFVDLLRRYLKYKGYQLTHVMNITDVDDNTIRRSQESSEALGDYTRRYTEEFLKDMSALRIEQPDIIPRATDHIPEMLALIDRLVENGHAYVVDDSVYYRISSSAQYGRLSKINLEGNISGARVDVDEYEKSDLRDFALWKATKPGEPSWDSSYGKGRPGWHIECSAMSMKYLGDSFDIHCGGVDLAFPHHENEIAQSEAATGKPFVRFWLHAEHLMVEGQRMAKRFGNYYTFRDLIQKGHTADAIRYLLLSVPYRKQLNFTFDSLRAAGTSLERIRAFHRRVAEASLVEGSNEQVSAIVRAARERFEAGLDDDLNAAVAIAAIFDFMREINAALDSNQVKAEDRARVLEFLESADRVLGVIGEIKDENLEPELQALLDERTIARQKRDWATSDRLRKELDERGIIVEDTPQGARWHRK